MCVCVCVCVCVCDMERLLPQFQAWLIGAWCSVYTYTFANVQMTTYKDRLGMLYKSSKHFWLLILCFLVSASSAAAPSEGLLQLGLKGLRERSP